MYRSRTVYLSLVLWSLIALSSYSLTASKYVVKQDAQAVAVAQAAFAAMGGPQALIGYQDSLSSGTVTIYAGGSPVSYPITLKSKGLRETRNEVQMPKGTSVRIVNQGQGAIIRPDGSVKVLDSNNTFYEYVNHVPLFSVLADYPGGSVNLLYQGTAQVQGQSEDVVEIDFIPNLSAGAGDTFASKSRALFFVNQTTKLLDKTQRTTFYEGDASNTFNEETYYADYRQISGLLVPFHQTVFIDGKMETDLTFTSVSFNVGLSDSDFALPKAR